MKYGFKVIWYNSYLSNSTGEEVVETTYGVVFANDLGSAASKIEARFPNIEVLTFELGTDDEDFVFFETEEEYRKILDDNFFL